MDQDPVGHAWPTQWTSGEFSKGLWQGVGRGIRAGPSDGEGLLPRREPSVGRSSQPEAAAQEAGSQEKALHGPPPSGLLLHAHWSVQPEPGQGCSEIKP